MKKLKHAVLVIYQSPNGQDNWEPVKPEDVPEWLKKPDVMGRLVNGYTARFEGTGLLLPDGIRPWYRAEVAKPDAEVAVVAKAVEKRERKARHRARTVH